MVSVYVPESPRPYAALGRRIAEARNHVALSQRELARLVNISEGYLPRIETGRNRPDPGILRDLARALDVDYEELAILSGYQQAPASEDTMPVKPGYRRVLERLQERFAPEQLSRFEQAMATLFLDLRRAPRDAGQIANGHRDGQGAEDGPESAPDDHDLCG